MVAGARWDLVHLLLLPKLFYLPGSSQESDIGLKTCWIREAEKQPTDLPFWPKTLQENLFPHCHKPKRPANFLLLPVFLSSQVLCTLYG